MPQYNTEEIIKASLENVEALNKKLNDLEELHNQIKQSIAESAKLPGLFEKLGINLNDTTEKYLSGNNDIFKNRINEILQKTTELGNEIERLEKVDFTISFQTLETKFLENTKSQLEKEFKKLDEKTVTLKSVCSDLEKEVLRLSEIDLEKHFEKHQNKLSEIFISVNGINGILTTLSQNVIKITQSIGEVEILLKSNQDKIQQGFEKISKNIEENQEKIVTQLSEIEKTAASNFIFIQTQIQASAKKQQIQTYITWIIIIITTIAIMTLCKK